jgi:MFS transporter, DHA2 family, methylenomycin A resistance protein
VPASQRSAIAALPTADNPVVDELPASVRRNSLLAVALGNFMVQMAMMPVSTILPTVATEFGIQLDVASWVMSAYLLLLTGWLLTAGRLGDQFGHRRVYVAGIALYMTAGTACGLAQSPVQLIALRAVQGIGGALMLGNGLAIVVHSFPVRQHGRAIGIAMMSASLGSTIGVAIGGVALEYLSWRWMFFVVAPLGAIALVAALGLRGVATPRKAHRVDWQGALLLFLMLTAVTLSLTHLHGGEESFEAGWPYHTAMQALALVLLGAFVVVERRAAEPMVLFQYFRFGRFTFPLLAHGVLHMVMMGTIFLAPFVIERGMLLSAGMTAAFLVTRQLVTVGMAPASGWLYDRTRSPLIAPLAMAGIAACLIYLGLQADHLDFDTFAIIGIPLSGFVGLFMTPNNTALMSALPADKKGFASGMLETARQMGHGLAVPIVSAVMTAAVLTDGPRLGAPAAYLIGYQHAVLLMAAFCVAAMFASIAGSCSRAGWASRAATIAASADGAPAVREPVTAGSTAR